MCRCRGEEGSIGSCVGQAFWLHGTEISTERHIKAAAQEQWQKVWNENINTAKALRQFHRGKACQEGPEAVQQTWRPNHCGDSYAIADRRLWPEPLPTLFAYQRHTML